MATTTAMEFARMSPSVSSLLSLYASFSASLMLLRDAYREFVPKWLESFLVSKLGTYFSARNDPPSCVTLVIDDSWGGYERNKLIKASNLYLSTKIGLTNKTIRIGKFKKNKDVMSALVEGEKVVDMFQGIEITWQFLKENSGGDHSRNSEDTHFEVTFEEKYREKIVGEYFSHVLKTCELLKQGEKILKLHSLDDDGYWDSIDLQHPATFDTLAMDIELKKAIMEDLDRFLGRKGFYRRVGKAWKRCYLLYGPPGTGKSSLVAAMANYLKFDVYEVELPNVMSEYDLREALLDTDNKSMIVIEDIDCHSELNHPSGSIDRELAEEENSEEEDYDEKLSPSDVMGCIERLWSGSKEERIIVLTTNQREIMEPALLRRSQIDMHIHMSYCTSQGFRVLALNYLGIHEHPLFEEIDGLLQSAKASPASLAEELLKSDDADIALREVVEFLKQLMLEKVQS